jgi:hypothetical protein
LVEVANGGAMSVDNALIGLFNPCKDFDIYFYADGSGGDRYLAEQMKKLKR